MKNTKLQNPSLRKRKGFTLIELIVVIAILAILAAIAIPNFVNIQNSAKVKSDAAVADQICSAARIQEVETGITVTALAAATGEVALSTGYMVVPTPQSGGTFDLSGGGTAAYVVTWTPTTAGSYNVAQTVTENAKFSIAQS
jgi:type IV pilus assembly protein PilA